MSVDSSAPARPARSGFRTAAAFLAAGVAAAAFALAAPLAADAAGGTVTTNVSTASAGGYVTLNVSGFQPNEALTFTLDSAPLTEYVEGTGTQDVADGSGDYVADAYIAAGPALGSHTITVTGGSTGPATTTITIVANPAASVSPASLPLSAYLSTGVTATFTGFPANASLEFGMASSGMGNGVGTGTANASGVATFTFVPTVGNGFDAAGTYAIIATTAANNITTGIQFTVTPNAVVAPTAPVADPATPVTKAASFTG